MGTQFGCKVIVSLRPGQTRSFSVDPEFPSKKAAKESAAKLAIKSGVIDEAKAHKLGGSDTSTGPSALAVRARTAGYPMFASATEAFAGFSRPTGDVYSAPINSRAVPMPTLKTASDDIEMAVPPPYVDDRRPNPSRAASATMTPSTCGIAEAVTSSTISDALIARQGYLSRADVGSTGSTHSSDFSSTVSSSRQSAASTAMTSRPSSLKGTPLGLQDTAAEQAHVRTLQNRLMNLFGDVGKTYIKYSALQDPDSGLWSATVRIAVPGGEVMTAEIDARCISKQMAEERVAESAIKDGGVYAKLTAQQRQRTSSQDSAGSSGHSAAQDPFSQPVSYLHQVCQVLLGSDTADVPKYELTKKEGGCMYS